MQPVNRRVVVDHNVFISALVFHSRNARLILDLVLAGEFQLVSSPHLLNELEELLLKRFGFSTDMVDKLRAQLKLISALVSPNRVSKICRDPDDDHVLAAALYGRVGWIVTGDKDLLDLGSYSGIEIVAPAQFLKLVSN